MTRARTAPRRVLIFAYYFPPMGLSGVQRTLKFAKYLPEFGWQPTVLTVEPAGYFAYDESLLEELEESRIRVHRTSSIDPTRMFGRKQVVRMPPEGTRRALSFLSQLFFVPDNKVGWWLPARRKALLMHEAEPFDLLFSTAPPYTAHLIAAGVARKIKRPLVLDFRDDWLGNPRHRYPTRLHRHISTTLERKALRSAVYVLTINDVIRRNLLERNADVLTRGEVVVIPQGFDQADFEAARRRGEVLARSEAQKCTLLYSGVFYDAQTPEPFLRGLAEFVRRHPECRSRIEAVFVGLLPESGRRLAEELSISKLIRHTGYLSHREAVAEISSADVLWMTIGRSAGAESISTSKLYEYIGARKPILGIVPDGAAKSELQRYQAAEIADPDDILAVSKAVERLFDAWRRSALPRPRAEFVEQFERRYLTGRLADLFHESMGAINKRASARTPAIDA